MGKQYEKPELEIMEFKESDFVVTMTVSEGAGKEGADFDKWIQ